MNIFKILPFSGKDTSGEYTLTALSIRFIGSVTIEPSSEGMFQVDYYTDRKVIREANRDIITSATIQSQLVTMGLDETSASVKAQEMMSAAILHLLGGASKEERYATLSQIIGSFGMELLPIGEQDGALFDEVMYSVPAETPMQEIVN
ncbi:hypothetical protein [Runella sp.]|uniref:hypothetical protein n=1 Tax=Runella sp. TaxID=1960881 RepID=UPI003D0AC6F2